MGTQDTLVESTTTSLVPLDGKSRQLSEQVAACLSSMKIEKQSSESYEQVVVLLTILLGITENTTSGDVLALGIYKAQDLCDEMGVDPTVFKETVGRFARFAEQSRKWNPLAY